MITYWEDMEEGGEGQYRANRGRRRRKSSRISEMSGKFEEGEKGVNSQTGGGEGRGADISFKDIHKNILSFGKQKENLSFGTKVSKLS